MEIDTGHFENFDITSQMRQLPIPFALLSEDDRFLFANEAMAGLLGCSPGAFPGSTGEDLLPPELLRKVRESERSVLATGRSQEVVHGFAESSGTRHYSFCFYLCGGRNGKTRLVACIGTEITRWIDEGRIADQEQRFRRLVEGLGRDHVFYSMLPDGTLTYAGPSADHFVGLPAEECVGRSVFELIPFDPESNGRARSELRRLLGGKIHADADLQYRHPDGSIRSMSVTSHPVFSSEGEVVGVQGIAWDITERRRTEAALLRREETFRAMLDATSDLVVLFDRNWTILEANEAYAQRLGRRREEILGRPMREVLPPERLARRYEDAGIVFSRNVPVHGVSVWGEFWEEYTIYPLHNSDGIPERAAYFAHDVTELKKRELELSKLRTAIEQANVVVVVVDGQGRVEFVNAQYLQMTGQSREKVLGRHFSVLRQWRLDKESRQGMRNAMRRKQPWRGEVHYRRRHGADFWADCSMTPVTRPADHEVLYVLVAKDITERKKLEELQAGAERIVRHNLKSPLNTISNVLYLLEKSSFLDEEHRGYLKLGEEALRRVLRQIDMSLALFRMETGLYHFYGCPVDVADIFRRELNGVCFRAERRGAEVRLLINGQEDAGQRVGILAERAHLVCMIDNLVDNAIAASTSGDKVELEIVERLPDDPGRVALRFRNTAPVPEVMRNRFFEKYVSYGKPGGTGLGTYSAKLITESMGGTISLSTGDQEGTCVEVRFSSAILSDPPRK